MGWGLEIAPDALRLCRAEPSRGGIRVRRALEAPLPAGLIQPSPRDRNLLDPAALAAPLAALAKGAGCRGSVRVALPDPVFILRSIPTDELPADRTEARQFLRWQARDHLPFPAEEARLDYLSVPPGPDGRARTACLVARERVLAEYEQLLSGASLRAAVVDARSVALTQAASALFTTRTSGLVCGCGVRTTLLIVEDGRPRVWRILAAEGHPGGASDLRFLREVSDSLLFFREAEGIGPVEQLFAHGLGSRTPAIVSALTDWLEVPVAPLDLRPLITAHRSCAFSGEDPTPWGAPLGVAIRPC